MCVCISLTIVVKGDQKASFLIATIPKFRGWRYSFLGIASFTLDSYLKC